MSSNNSYISKEEFEEFKRLTMETISALAQQGWANQQAINNLTEIADALAQLQNVNYSMFEKYDSILSDIRGKIQRMLPPGE